ncbi:helix-turn-helix transcriptional regulator [Patulibacter defluvii]|uniref:helix-turn-helix transcriptional regulator n=1 Tax=Patulibacter defluvii TaxID=3095358 RepID=UPI002A74FB93|nr:response regulator transcription factor [Patulibacter sp. DM4]
MTVPPPSEAGGRVLAAVVQWAEVGPASELLQRAPADIAAALPADRVLLSSVRDGALHAIGAWTASGDGEQLVARLAAEPAGLEYPSAEGDALRRRAPQLQLRRPRDVDARHAWSALLGWERYVIAPVIVQGSLAGLLHADRAPGAAPVDEGTRDDLGAAAVALALVFERAILRQRLRQQQREMQRVARWVGDRSASLSEGVRSLDDGVEARTEQGEMAPQAGAPASSALRDLLTRRELEVLELMARGASNGEIARELVVSEGTIKFHVKNVLRKMHASNRAQATSRYLRLIMRERPAGS